MHPSILIHRRTTVTTLLAAVLTLMVAPMPKAQDKAAATGGRTFERTVSVSATGSVAAEPDMAHISTGVIWEAETAREALAGNSAAMRRVIDGLKALGIEPRDIQTVSLNVEPRYPSKTTPGSTPQIAGYRVVNQIRVTVRRLVRLGEVLDQVVSLGANQMHGLVFDVSESESLKDKARKIAIANALHRARLYAQTSGAEVGAVLAISEEMGHVPHGATMSRSAMLESVPIERGSQAIEVRVNVTWALK